MVCLTRGCLFSRFQHRLVGEYQVTVLNRRGQNTTWSRKCPRFLYHRPNLLPVSWVDVGRVDFTLFFGFFYFCWIFFWGFSFVWLLTFGIHIFFAFWLLLFGYIHIYIHMLGLSIFFGFLAFYFFIFFGFLFFLVFLDPLFFRFSIFIEKENLPWS